MKYHLGDTKILENLPKSITVLGDPYILQQVSEKKYVLFSAICPHMHNVVSHITKKVWRCPSHDWTYDPKNGNCINVSSESLSKKNLIIENGEVYVNIYKKKNKPIQKSNGKKIPPKITLVGSAALLIEWEGFNILTDPWIKGLCMLDSWVNYPPSKIKVDELPKIDAIWISHEHSDHFHIPTLMEFDKNIPIYVPDYDEKRLERKLRQIGFKKVISMIPEKNYKLSSKINAISFSRGHVFTDSILYLQLGNFSLLNVNDAGFNWLIRNFVGNVDMVCIQFRPISAYPATWTHLDDETKIQINKKRSYGYLRMMKQIVEFTNAKYLVPIASYSELYNKQHLEYIKYSESKINPSDIIKYLSDNPVKIIDIYPGESWIGKTKKFVRRQDRKILHTKSHRKKYLASIQGSSEFKPTLSSNFDLTHKELKRYFESFSNAELTKRVGNYTVMLTLKSSKRELHGFIKFNNGIVTYKSVSNPINSNLTMACPGNLVQEIIRNGWYWDEIAGGCWCKFSRNPDVYNTAFWQLLHVPWRAINKHNGKITSGQVGIKTDSSIADILEKGGDQTIKIFEKQGLFCVGCESSIGETIEEACEIHGLTSKQKNRLISELSEVVNHIKN